MELITNPGVLDLPELGLEGAHSPSAPVLCIPLALYFTMTWLILYPAPLGS